MLNNGQIKILKKEAHHLKPIFQIGKGGLNSDMIIQIGQALEKRELIKINLLQNTLEEPEHVGIALTEALGLHVVQIIGHTLVLYKKASKEKYRKVSTMI